MALDNIVSAARNNGHKKPISANAIQQMQVSGKFIDATVGGQYRPVRRSRSTSINAIAREIEAMKPARTVPTDELTWEKCANLRKSDNQPLCSKYFGFCAQEKCPKRYMDA